MSDMYGDEYPEEVIKGAGARIRAQRRLREAERVWKELDDKAEYLGVDNVEGLEEAEIERRKAREELERVESAARQEGGGT